MIAKNLLVNGSSRFLNTAYFQDVSIDSLSLSGNLSVTGTSTLTGHVSIGGYNNASYGLSASSAIINSWIRTTGSTGWYNESHGGGWYMTDNDYVRSFGKPVMMGHNLYFNSTSYYVNTSGAASFSSIASPSATISNATISGDLTVNGVLQANDFIKNIVKAVGGQLYVSPTFQATDSTTVTCTAVTATQLSLTLSDNAINGTDYAGATWYKDSKVMLSGTLTANTTGHTEEIIFSSVPGVVTANMSSSNKLQIKLDYDGASTYFKTGTLTTSDVAVMMYQINIPSGSTNAGLHPIGIYIKAYGTDNKNSYIDIFGGTSNTPNARLGLLTGLSAMQNGTSPSGWGIATTNGFFDGTIVSSSGKIGAFTLSSDLRSGTWGTSGSVLVAGGYAPTTADAKSIGGSPTTGNTWAFTAGSAFGVTTAGKIYASDAEISGKITATSGSIAGWRIESTYLASDTATAPAANVLLLSPAGTSSSYTVAGTAKSGWMITAGTTFGVNKDGGVYATSGQIGGVKIATGAIYSSGKSAYNSNDAGFYLGSDGKFGLGKNNTYYLRWDGTNLAMNVQSLSIAGTNTATAISNAAGTASNYLYYDSTNGLVVSQTGVVATGYNTQITSTDGVNIRNGSTVLANYGSTVTIGQTTGYNTYIDGNGLNIRNGSTALATYGSTIILGKLAADTTHVEIDSDSFDVCSGAATGANSTKLATFGTTITLGQIANGVTRIRIDNDSFDVISRDNNTDTTIATFGTTVTLGNTSVQHIVINDTSFSFNDGDNIQMQIDSSGFHFGEEDSGGDLINDIQFGVSQSGIIFKNKIFDEYYKPEVFSVNIADTELHQYTVTRQYQYTKGDSDMQFDERRGNIYELGTFLKGITPQVYLSYYKQNSDLSIVVENTELLDSSYYTYGFDEVYEDTDEDSPEYGYKGPRAWVIFNSSGISAINSKLSSYSTAHSWPYNTGFYDIHFNVTTKDPPSANLDMYGDLNVKSRVYLEGFDIREEGGNIICREIANEDGITLGSIKDTMQFVNAQWISVTATVAAGASGTAKGTFTKVNNATGYIAIPISTYEWNICTSNPVISGTNISAGVKNISSGQHTCAVRILVLGYKWVN